MKRLFLSLILSLMLCGSVSAANFYVDNDRPDNTGNGTSWATAKKTIQAGINLLATTGDVLILDEDTWIISSSLGMNTCSATGSVEVKSKNENAAVCIIDANDGAHSIFNSNKAGLTTNLTGITFRNATRTDGNAVFIISQGSDFTLDGVVFDDLDQNRVGGGNHPLLYFYGQTFVATLTDCIIKNCDYISSTAVKGAFISSDTSNVDLVASNLTVENCTSEITGLFSGGIYVLGDLTLSGTNIFRNITTIETVGAAYAFLRVTGGTATISGSNTFDNIDQTTTSGISEAVVALFACAATITGDIEVMNCDHVSTETGNTIGIFTGYGNGNSLTITGPKALFHDNTSLNIDGAITGAQGANLTLSKVDIYDNTLGHGGGVRFGGWCQGTINLCKIYNNDSGTRGAVYSMLHANATEDVTHTITNCVIYGNTGDGSDGIYIEKAGASGFELTMNITNTVIWNQDNNKELVISGANPVVSIVNCNVRGGADAVEGEDTYTDNINSDPRFYNASAGNFTLRGSSPCIDAGTDVSLTHDFNGWRIPNGSAPDIGVYEHYRKTYGGMHQSVSKKTSGTILKVEESGMVNLDSTNGIMTIYLPPLELSRGVPFFLHKDNAGNNITIVANGDGVTIGGAASKTLTNQYDSIILWGGIDQWYSK